MYHNPAGNIYVTFNVMTDAVKRESRFRELVGQEVYNVVWRYCYRLTGNREDAEDLSQEVLARAYLRLDQLKDADRIKGWLVSIARTLYIDWTRKGRIDTVPVDGRERPVDGYSTDGAAVRQAVTGLPERQRVVIELFHFEELSHSDLAAALKISVNTVKQRLHRGRETLRRRLGPSFSRGDLEALL